MKRISIVILFTILVVCNYCGQDFKVLNRDSRRCKSKSKSFTPNDGDNSRNDLPNEATGVESNDSCNSDIVQCICGKRCKGLRGLKAHQRSCRSLSSLRERDTFHTEIFNQTENVVTDDQNTNVLNNSSKVKEGIKLPKKAEDWELANTYFQLTLSTIDVENNLNHVVEFMNTTVYDYFKDNCEYKNIANEQELMLKERYKLFTKKDLKKELKSLKFTKSDIASLKFVSRLLRSKVDKKSVDISVASDNDEEISKNFWKYAKNILTEGKNIIPTFTRDQCTTYFKRVLQCFNPSKSFMIPSWMPTLANPEIAFNMEPPTYNEISKIINKIKTSGSPCPLDQISVICFKRCSHKDISYQSVRSSIPHTHFPNIVVQSSHYLNS